MGYRPVEPRLSRRDQRHRECLVETAKLERELYGEVVSPSVAAGVPTYPPRPPRPSKGGATTAK